MDSPPFPVPVGSPPAYRKLALVISASIRGTRVSRAACSRIFDCVLPTLHHEVLDESMEDGAVIIAFCAKLHMAR